MARDFSELARLWIDSYGDEILRLPGDKLVKIANQCIDAELVPHMAPVKPRERTMLAEAVRRALADDARLRAAADENMPMLAGSELQEHLGEIIRRDAIANARALRQWAVRNRDEQAVIRLDSFVRDVLRKETRARWFVDHRPDHLEFLLNAEANPRWTSLEDGAPLRLEEENAYAEITLYPKGKHGGVTEVTVTDAGQLAVQLKDTLFFRIVKNHHMILDPTSMKWQCNLETGRTPSEQIAQLAGELLAEGFEVLVPDENAREKVRTICDRPPVRKPLTIID